MSESVEYRLADRSSPDEQSPGEQSNDEQSNSDQTNSELSGEIIHEESHDGKWPALLTNGSSIGSGTAALGASGDRAPQASGLAETRKRPVSSISRDLFHFFRLERTPPLSVSAGKQLSQNSSATQNSPGKQSPGIQKPGEQNRGEEIAERPSQDGGAGNVAESSTRKASARRRSAERSGEDASINQAKTKDDDGFPRVAAPDINALVVTRDGRRGYAGMNSGDLLELELLRENPPRHAGKAAAPAQGADLRLRRKLLLGDSEKRPILAIAVSRNERYLAITRFGLVQIFDLFRQKLLYELTKIETRLVAIDWDPRTELVVFGGIGGDIYTWNVFEGPASGRDSMDAVEAYEATAPVVSLLFHPSARAFFAALQNGSIMFWRLLRTERELGLRDEAAKIDLEKRGRTASTVASLPGRPETLWLEEGGSKVFASCADGKVHRWLVRGLERQTDIFLGTEQVSNVLQIPFVIASKKSGTRTAEIRPLIASGRGQRLSLYCPKAPDENLNSTAVSVVASDAPAEAPPAAILVDGRIEELGAPTPTPTPVPNTTVPIAPIGESDRFDSPLQHFAVGADSAVLWAVQKGGTLVVFDATQLKQTKWLGRELDNCLSQPGS